MELLPNTFESASMFVLYICDQDGKISNQELDEFTEDFPYLKTLYFDLYGEFIHEDFLESLGNIIQHVKEKNFTSSRVSKKEHAFFSNLITDPKLQDICLLESKHAASADFLHPKEKIKLEYWTKIWT